MNGSDIAQLASLAHSQISHAQPEYQRQDESQQGGKRKAEDDQQGASKSRRSRYISLACNECKRRKIKCNGQNPCQRCGNLSLECVYTPNCCNGFKDSQEYRDMSAHMMSLQEQVNALYENLTALRVQLGHTMPVAQPQTQQQQQPPQPSQQSAQYAQSATIDPSLQNFNHQTYTLEAHELSPQQSMARRQSHSQQRQFQGIANVDFDFGTAKNTLQDMDIGTKDNEIVPMTIDLSHGKQLQDTMHESKDPIWAIKRTEAERLCKVYDEELTSTYPFLDIEKIDSHIRKLFPFLEAMHRSGLMQQGFPGADALEDDETNVLKLVMAIALTIEGSGRSELGQRLFDSVQPAVGTILLGNVSTKGVRLLILSALYETERDNEGTSRRLIALAARLCKELGLNRQEAYDKITDEKERSEVILLFWTCFVLDQHWTLATGMQSVFQEKDIDPKMPKPYNRSPFLTAMIEYSEISSKVWRAVSAHSAAENDGKAKVDTEVLKGLDRRLTHWQRDIPLDLHLDERVPSNANQVSSELLPKLLLYLRSNQMHILALHHVMFDASLTPDKNHLMAQTVDYARDIVRRLTWTNDNTALFRRRTALFQDQLMSALVVLLTAVTQAPNPAIETTRIQKDFQAAVELTSALGPANSVSGRLNRAISALKTKSDRLDRACAAKPRIPKPNVAQPFPDASETDPSRSAAMAMAGLAGHPIEETALAASPQSRAQSNAASIIASPEDIAQDLTTTFEISAETAKDGEGLGIANSEVSAILKELL